MDCIDLIIDVPQLQEHDLTSDKRPQQQWCAWAVRWAHERQMQRQESNSALSVDDLEQLALIATEAKLYLSKLMNDLNLSARSYHRLLRVARTAQIYMQMT